MRNKVGSTEIRTGTKSKPHRVLTSLLFGIAALALVERSYLVRELLLFVALSALLVFVVAGLAVLGILAYALWRGMFELVGTAYHRIVSQLTEKARIM
jgi:hypothetical protein